MMARFFPVKFILTTALAFAVLTMSTLASLADITGAYYAYGRNADGSAYDGTVVIGQNADGSFTVNWTVGTTYSGTGVLAGQVLTVEWGARDPAIYVVMPDGDLHGTWADGTGLELLSRTPR